MRRGSDRRRVVVTGAAGGIGRAVAERFRDEGLAVTLVDRDRPALDALDPAFPSQFGHALVPCDVTSAEDVEGLAVSVAAHDDPVVALISNAGIARPARLAAASIADWTAMLDVHLTGAARMCHALHPCLASADHAAVVLVSSVQAHRGAPGRASYGAAKAGLEGLARALAVEWALDGIRVNAVAPGYIHTELSDRIYRAGGADRTARERVVPMGRLGRVGEVAEAIHWLALRATYVTGHTLVVDGGYLIEGAAGAGEMASNR